LDSVVRSLENYSKQAIAINKNVKELLATLKAYQQESSQNNLPNMQASLTKASAKLDAIQSKLSANPQDKMIASLNEWISNEGKNVRKKSEEYADDFVHELNERLSDAGFDFKGHYPLFYVRNVKVRLDPTKLRVTLVYGGDEEKILEIQGLDSKAVVSALKSFYDYLEKLNYRKELDPLFKAYVHAVRKDGKSEGEWAPIIKVLNEYIMQRNSSEQNREFFINPSKGSFREIGPYGSRIVFSYMLYKLLKSNLTARGGYRLNKKTAIHGSAGKWEEHLWLPITENDVQGENAMYINFSEDS